MMVRLGLSCDTSETARMMRDSKTYVRCSTNEMRDERDVRLSPAKREDDRLGEYNGGPKATSHLGVLMEVAYLAPGFKHCSFETSLLEKKVMQCI
jgi:hypothetical protein